MEGDRVRNTYYPGVRTYVLTQVLTNQVLLYAGVSIDILYISSMTKDYLCAGSMAYTVKSVTDVV